MQVEAFQGDAGKDAVAANLRALKAYRQKTDGQIAAEMGEKRSWVQERISGNTECKATDILKFAFYFGVPVGRLFTDANGTPLAGGFEKRGNSTRRNRTGPGRGKLHPRATGHIDLVALEAEELSEAVGL